MVNQRSDDDLRRVLNGRRVIVTRPSVQGDALVARLTQLGANSVRIQPLEVAPPAQPELLKQALERLHDFDWIAFTSANAVRAVAGAMKSHSEQHATRRPRIAAVGRATADVVESLGIPVEFISTESNAAAFGRTLPVEQGENVFIPRAEKGLPDLAATLRKRGATVTDVIAYRLTQQPKMQEAFSALWSEPVDALTFASPSAVTQFLLAASLSGWTATHAQATQGLLIVCIGPTTAAAARSHGLRVDGIADEPSQEGLVNALANSLESRDKLSRIRTLEPHV